MNRQNMMVVAGASAISLATGLVLGHFLTIAKVKKELGAEFDAKMDEELAAAKDHYQKLYKVGPQFASPQAYAAKSETDPDVDENPIYEEAVRQYQSDTGEHPIVKSGPPKQQTRNVFREADKLRTVESPEWAEELASRDLSAPYVVHIDEYMENAEEFDQATLEWFAGDAVLANEKQEVVQEDHVDGLVGIDNLRRFGEWSNDPNVVYVCNPRINMMYEICLNRGSYTKEVLGFEAESRPQNRKSPDHQNVAARERFERGSRVGGRPRPPGDNG